MGSGDARQAHYIRLSQSGGDCREAGESLQLHGPSALLNLLQALVSAKLDETYSSIRDATYGIAFFGTPHQGGNGAKLGQIAATIAGAFLRNPKNTFLEALKKDSLFANDLIKDFRHQLEDYYVLSFHETLPYKKLGLVS